MKPQKKIYAPKSKSNLSYSAISNQVIKNSFSECHLKQNDIKKIGLSKNFILEIITRIRESERIKIGRELHDNVNQLLATARLYLSLLIARTDKDMFMKQQVDSIIMSAIEDIRNVSSDLVISQKLKPELNQLIADLTDKVGRTGLFKINFSYRLLCKKIELSPEIKLTIYRVVQEQLNNAIKYSHANNVEVNLICNSDFVNLTIRDDGVGFDTLKRPAGIGFMNISERVALQKGHMKLTSSPGNGCCLEISIPCLMIVAKQKL